MKAKLNIIISGGGTGGHIFPAISIGKAIKQLQPDANILFIGATGKIEMDKVPAAGFNIIGLPVRGFERKFSFNTLVVVFKLIAALIKSFQIMLKFKPHAVIGVGGYASGPIMFVASLFRKPIFIQEQNSHAGVTNKILSKRAKKIYVAYEGMEKYFAKEKIMLTGNPIRKNLVANCSKADALQFFNLQPNKKTILLLGGSGGARTLNRAVIKSIETVINSDIQFIWQTGKFYIEEARNAVKNYEVSNLFVTDFIVEMDKAFLAADLVISRAGAGTISELCALGKASILVPSPNVAEDHQTKNAKALAANQAAVLITDKDAATELISKAIALCNNDTELKKLSENCLKMALPDADNTIVNSILNEIN